MTAGGSSFASGPFVRGQITAYSMAHLPQTTKRNGLHRAARLKGRQWSA